ncbi:MAG: fold metallo-hydrolase [Dehalococcoidia bacterium]|nr:fold metallo-hydrolase [Dehalococcoidia bacterium]
MPSTLAVVCDSVAFQPGLRPSAGFACLIKTQDKNVLFDTGPHLSTLLHNMEKLSLSPQEIDAIVLSHNDSDHAGALFDLLALVKGVTVYLLDSSPALYKERVARAGATVIGVDSPVAVAEGLMSTGELGGSPSEQALVLHTGKGPALIIGCGHSGLVNTAQRAKQLAGSTPHLVLGGFHLESASRPQIEATARQLQELGIEQIAPCHCTGERARYVLKQIYGDNFIACGSGKVIGPA